MFDVLRDCSRTARRTYDRLMIRCSLLLRWPLPPLCRWPKSPRTVSWFAPRVGGSTHPPAPVAVSPWARICQRAPGLPAGLTPCPVSIWGSCGVRRKQTPHSRRCHGWTFSQWRRSPPILCPESASTTRVTIAAVASSDSECSSPSATEPDVTETRRLRSGIDVHHRYLRVNGPNASSMRSPFPVRNAMMNSAQINSVKRDTPRQASPQIDQGRYDIRNRVCSLSQCCISKYAWSESKSIETMPVFRGE